MRLPVVSWRSDPEMKRLIAALGGSDGDTRFVGGCVRDALLGIDASDVDLATRLRPDEVMTRLKAADIRAVPTGIDHGTITAVLRGRPVEVTTLRRDVSTDGRRATIAYTDDWREDAARRDFTINALSADPESGRIFDYFGGLEDLESRAVRFIGDPLVRIAEDHLRILRFFRFHARFGRGEPERDGMEACASRANDLMALSRERIADELLKLLALPDPAPTVALMLDRGILRPVLPELEDVPLLSVLPEREREAGVDPDPIRRLAALLPADPAVATDVAARLRLSNKTSKRLVAIAGRGPADDANPAGLAYRIGRAEAIDRLLLSGASAAAASLEDWQRPRLPLSGGDLIRMGLKPGPLVAQTLHAIEQEWMAKGFPDDPAIVRAIARRRLSP